MKKIAIIEDDQLNRGDVSFTFLHRIDEIELNIKDQRWQSALALALTIPDICGGIAFPELVKKYRDGRMILDRQGNPSRDVGAQYVQWFDTYVGGFFKASPRDAKPYICGERCWQLRCEYLHQNKGFLNEENDTAVRFHLGIHCGSSVCRMDTAKQQDQVMEIRIDIEQFCLRICRAARSYYHETYKEKDFSLYNTPVLDFIQAQKKKKTEELVVIICKDTAYARGLEITVGELPVHIMSFPDLQAMKKKIGNRRPNVWIIREEIQDKVEQEPWFLNTEAPVIFLTQTGKLRAEKKEGKFTMIQMPIQPKELLDAVKAGLK